MRKALMLVLALVLLVAFASQNWANEPTPQEVEQPQKAHAWEEDNQPIVEKVSFWERLSLPILVPSSECPPPCVEIYHWGRGERVCVCGQMQ